MEWPQKTREMHNHHMDSTRWNGFPFRDDDVVIATWGKTGTTWTQQIVGQLIHHGSAEVQIHQLSPWLEFRVAPWPDILHMLEAQTERRVIKTHLPVDALVFSPMAKYLYVGRDARDVVWSIYNHHSGFKPGFYHLVNEVLPGLQGEPLRPPNPDVRAYYSEFLDLAGRDADGGQFWPFWSHVQSWWDIRHLPNVLLVHFAALKADPEGEIRRIADFLDIEIDPAVWPAILEHSSFAYMKANAAHDLPFLADVFESGADTFINKGTNGRWRDVLSADEIARCDVVAAANLTPDCARWLATGAPAA